jgi:hypothetical protein
MMPEETFGAADKQGAALSGEDDPTGHRDGAESVAEKK